MKIQKHITYLFSRYLFLIQAPALTFKGQVAKESRQEVHGVHDKDGDVGHLLHSLLGWTGIREKGSIGK